MKKEMICIVCPRGCHLSISDTNEVSGNFCPRGKIYALSELNDPKRILTTTMRTTCKQMPRISCKSDKPLKKDLLFKAMDVINQTVVDKPVKMGDVLIANILDTDVNIIATKSCKEGEDD